MELNLKKETRTALWKMIHRSEGIDANQIADAIGDTHKTVLNYANQNMDYFPSLKKFEAMLFFTGNPTVLKVWAHEIGYMCIPSLHSQINQRHLGVIESLLNVNIESGNVNQHVLKAWEDGIITANELSETAETLEKLEQSLRDLRKALEMQAEKYFSNLTKERA